MIIDGRKVAEERIAHMRDFVTSQGIHPLLRIFAMEPDVATLQYLKIKKRIAERIGVELHVENWPASLMTKDVIERIGGAKDTCSGIVLQLPFPASIDLESLLDVLPAQLDPDRMGKESVCEIREEGRVVIEPVVSAIRLLLTRQGIMVNGAHAAVVGQGRLVGVPAAEWFVRSGASVTRFTRDVGVDPSIMRRADMIVLGAGSPGLLTPGMIKGGVAIFDAGTSEEGGRVVGDADPRCAEKAGLFTPVPGGVGPIAVAELFSNMLALQFGYEPLK